MFYILFSTLILIASTCIQAASSSNKQLTKFPKVLTIPPLSGWGSTNGYLAKATGARKTDLVNVSTPYLLPDLGQRHCQYNLDKTIATLPADDEYILVGTSQGTATAFNHAGKGPSRLRAIVAEACLASGNTAIAHTVSGKQDLVSSLLFPYLARVKLPLYNPSGMQPIKSIATIDPEMPVILLHATEDPCLPFTGALALYYGLRSRGHHNTYLITVDDDRHMGLFNADNGATRKILAHHNLVPADGTSDQESSTLTDLKAYQPDYQAFKAHYQRALFIERIHRYADIPVTFTMLYTILWFFGITQTLGLPI